MIELEHIEKKNDVVTCTAFVEDCKDPIELVFHVDDGSLDEVRMPAGYEWCIPHLNYAKRALSSMIDVGEIERRTCIMWY